MIEFEGIVIRTTPFRDNDAMVSVLSNDKMWSFLARGVQKLTSKNGPSVNIYAHSRFVLSNGKDGLALRSGEMLESFPNAKSDLDCLAVLGFLSEATCKYVLGEDAPRLYDFLLKSLRLVNDGFEPYVVALIYLAKVLEASGYGLQVDNCVRCGQKRPIVALSYNDGGFICEDCFDGVFTSKYDARQLKIIRYIFKVDVERFGQVSFEKEETEKLLYDLIHFACDVYQTDIKSLSLLRKI